LISEGTFTPLTLVSQSLPHLAAFSIS